MILKKFRFFDKLSLNEDYKQLKDRNAANKIRRNFMYISNNYGFFADLLFKLKIVEAKPGAGVDTMCTDGKSIAYWPPYVNKLTDAECAWVLLHEVLHNANFHNMRMGNRKAIVTTIGADGQKRKYTLWNIAADYSINLQLEDLTGTHIKRPEGVCFDKKYEDMSAEKIYDILYKETPTSEDPDDGDGGEGDPDDKPGQGKPKPGQGKPQPGQQPGKGQPGGTELTGDMKAPGELDGVGESLYEGSEELEGAKGAGDIDKTWGEILSDAKSKNPGTGSPSLDRWFNKIGKPKVNWKRILLKFMNQCFAADPKYGYFNKKFIAGGDYLPGMKYPKTEGFRTIVLIIDTSGSISQATLSKFASEFYGIFTTKKIEECIVIWCDDRVQKVERIKTKTLSGTISKTAFEEKFLQKLRPSGAGGTSFIPPFKWLETNLIQKTGVIPSFAVYFTDAAGTAPEPNKYSIPLYFKKILWVITDTMTAPHIKFPEKIFLDKNPE